MVSGLTSKQISSVSAPSCSSSVSTNIHSPHVHCISSYPRSLLNSFLIAVDPRETRPKLTGNDELCPPSLRKLISACWAQDPQQRPVPRKVLDRLLPLIIATMNNADGSWDDIHPENAELIIMDPIKSRFLVFAFHLSLLYKLRTTAACIRGEPLLLITDLMELGNLEIWSKDNKRNLNLLTVMKLMSDVTKGLSILHREKILHLDVKPSNILLHHGEGNTIRAKLAGTFSYPLAIALAFISHFCFLQNRFWMLQRYVLGTNTELYGGHFVMYVTCDLSFRFANPFSSYNDK